MFISYRFVTTLIYKSSTGFFPGVQHYMVNIAVTLHLSVSRNAETENAISL